MIRKPRLLFVDDEPEILELLSLTFHEFEAETALNADSALDLLRGKHFDVLITDLRMPGTSGLKLVESANSHAPGILVFVITAYPQDVPQDTDDRVKRWIFKPFNMTTVRASVLDALEER